MIFGYKEGEAVQQIAERYARAGQPIPDNLPDAPQIGYDGEYYLALYSKLDTLRLYEGGPIPFTAVRDIVGDDVENAWQVIRYVDVEMTNFFVEERKRKQKLESARGKRAGKKGRKR